MAYKVIITEQAQNNFYARIDYVRLILCEERAAEDLYAKYNSFIEKVSILPEIYLKLQDERLLNHSLRRALIKNYVAVYEFNGETVTVLGFYHQKQDYARFCL